MVPLRRREFLHSAAAQVVAGSLCLPNVWSAANAQAVVGNSTRLRDDLHVFSVEGSNVLALADSDGAVLVDGVRADQAAGFLAMLVDRFGSGRVQTLFNTCWHRERTGLNEMLGRAGATIIAHENTKLWLTIDVTLPWSGHKFEPLPAVARPNETFYDEGGLVVGDRRIQYGHVRASPHTDGDMYVLFQDSNVLVVGEAVSGEGWPSIDWWTGGWIGGVVAALESFLSIADDDTLIIPARGPVMSRSDLEAQFAMFDVIYERLVDLFYSAKGPDEVVAARPTSEFDSEMGPPDEFVRRAFRSLWGFLSPDA